MLEKLWIWANREDSHEQQQRDAARQDAEWKNAARMDTSVDIARLGVYVMRNKRDYQDHPAAFFYPPPGFGAERIKKEAHDVSMRPEHKDVRIYVEYGSELWTLINGEMTKKILFKKSA